MARFIIKGRSGPGDRYKKEGEVDTPVEQFGQHFVTAMQKFVDANGTAFESRQFVVEQSSTGEVKPFNVRLQHVVTEA